MKWPIFWRSKKDINKINGSNNNDGPGLVIFEFANRTNVKKFVWVEPTAVSIEIEADTEYQLITTDKHFRIEFAENEIFFYLDYSFGFILNRRPTSEKIDNPNPWTLDADWT